MVHIRVVIFLASFSFIKAQNSPPIFNIPETFIQFVSSLLERNKDPSLYYNTDELIHTAGYPVENHKVETEDGFLLTVHRIPSKREGFNIKKRNVGKFHYGLFERTRRKKNAGNNFILGSGAERVPVLIQHGIAAASDSWVLQGPGYDLAYLLANAGYDVWLGNCRGNYYSRYHRNYTAADDRFWDFSFHEMGYYDLPAVIDYILNLTKADKLHYIGHSMGTTMFFVMASTRPEYNQKIRLFSAMAPVTSMRKKNMRMQKKIVFESAERALAAFRLSNTQELFPRVNWTPLAAHALCRKGSPIQNLCFDLAFFWAGTQSKLILNRIVPLIMSHVPSGFSLKTATHFVQIMESEFRQYDYGPSINLKIYGEEQPPIYNLSKITCPVSIHYSAGDFLTDDKDVISLINQLRTMVNVQRLVKLNHIDFVWAYNAKDVVYSEIMNLMRKY